MIVSGMEVRPMFVSPGLVRPMFVSTGLVSTGFGSTGRVRLAVLRFAGHSTELATRQRFPPWAKCSAV
jgi:hypothetical protein